MEERANPESELEYQGEDGLPYIPPPSRPSPDQLRQQAQSLRQVSRESIRESAESEAPLWAKLAAAAFFALVISATVWVLISEAPRRQLAAASGELWVHLSGQQENHLLRLPPPSRQARISQVIQGRSAAHFSAAPASDSESAEPQGILYYNLSPEQALAQASRQEQQASTAPELPPEKTPAAAAAFEFLIENSEAARKLSAGELADYQFKEWRPVRNAPPLYLINLLATDSQGREISLIWQVDMENKEQRAMSQQARELAAQFQ